MSVSKLQTIKSIAAERKEKERRNVMNKSAEYSAPSPRTASNYQPEKYQASPKQIQSQDRLRDYLLRCGR